MNKILTTEEIRSRNADPKYLKKSTRRLLGEMYLGGGYIVQVKSDVWELPVHLGVVNVVAEIIDPGQCPFRSRHLMQAIELGLLDAVTIRMFKQREMEALGLTEKGTKAALSCRDDWFARDATMRLKEYGSDPLCDVEFLTLGGEWRQSQ